MTNLSRFRIDGLHGRNRAINVPIVDNRLVLVGENGTGKSTFVSLLYYFLTMQWRRIVEYRFTTVRIECGDESVQFAHEDVEALLELQNEQLRRRGRSVFHTPNWHLQARLFEEIALADLAEDSAVERLSELESIPRSIARQVYREYKASERKLEKEGVLKEVNKLKSWKFGQFLYLPTYRRIEQDLKSIFRGIEIEEKVKEFRERLRKRQNTSYIELIEFGMEDVERTIHNRMSQIKENVRTGLNTLTGTYLRDVIKGLQENPEVSVLRSIDPSGFQSMFARIDEAILPASDKSLLQSKVQEIVEGSPIGPDDKVVAHFLSKLVSLYVEQQRDESDVRDFVQLCNEYLTGKQLIYDDVKYEIYVRLDNGPEKAKERETLPLKTLSSGEKQIVSLFSHMYLSGESAFFVVIDEPELSLSVPWQQRFLPDIWKTGRCTGLISVTHSPFIWENEMEVYVKSLAEFVELANDI